MRKILIPVVLLFFSSICGAQQKPRNNSLSFEVGKTGLIYNLVYDHQFSNRFGIRAGGGSNFSVSIEVTTGGGDYIIFLGSVFQHQNRLQRLWQKSPIQSWRFTGDYEK